MYLNGNYKNNKLGVYLKYANIFCRIFKLER